MDAGRDFVALYEAKAYLVFNLALRITCERDKAMRATESAFLGQATPGATPVALVPAVVQAALGEARKKPQPDAAADPEEQAMLRAVAKLAGTQRATLALTGVAEADAGAVAGALGLNAEAASELTERAETAFASVSGLAPEAAAAAYAEWTWAAPPPELWERLYPEFMRAIERHGDSASDAATTVLPAVKKKRRLRIPIPRRRPRMIVLAGLLIPGLLVAGAVAYSQRKSPTNEATASNSTSYAAYEDPGDTSPQAVAESADVVDAAAEELDDPGKAKPRKPLTPKELDALRLQELRELKRYERQQTDKRLTKAQRDYAARKTDELRGLAHLRTEAERTKKRLAREERARKRRERRLARKRAQQGEEGGRIIVETDEGTKPPAEQSPSQPDQSGPGSTEEAQNECLQDADSGQYICPG